MSQSVSISSAIGQPKIILRVPGIAGPPGSGGSGGVTDGDKGDITVSASGLTWTIDPDAVGNTKLANMASGTIKARIAAGTGDPQDATAPEIRTLLNVEDGAQVNVGTDLSYTASSRLLSSSTGADATLPEATTSLPGLQSAADKTKLDGIAAGAQVNVPTDLSYTASTRLLESSTGTDVTLPEATTAVAGLMSGADKTKLNGVEVGAQVNVATDLSYTASTRLLSSSTGADVNLPEATTTVSGLQSAADKTKLDGIEAGAQVNVGTDLSYTASSRLLASSTGADVTLPEATTTLAGLQSAADKTRIDQLGADDSPSFTGLTITGTAPVIIPHVHGSIAGNFYVHVRNTSGGPLAAGTAVYATGSVGDTDRITVSACDPTDPLKMPAIAVLETTLANNGDGDAVVLGELRPFNTNSYQLGDQLYVGAGGALVATIPASGEVQQVGSVARVNVNTGTILVNTGAAMARVGFTGAYGDLSGRPPVVLSDPTGITGADAVTNIISLTQAEYDAIATPSATTLYVITS